MTYSADSMTLKNGFPTKPIFYFLQIRKTFLHGSTRIQQEKCCCAGLYYSDHLCSSGYYTYIKRLGYPGHAGHKSQRTATEITKTLMTFFIGAATGQA
jgi:hypothetical protein